MSYKLYNCHQDKTLLGLGRIKSLQEFSVQENDGRSANEVMSAGFDVIETDSAAYEKFRPFLRAVDWQTSQIGSADALVLSNGVYKPFNVMADTILRVIRQNRERINSQQPVIVVGNRDFVYSVVTKLALSGFIEIIVSLLGDNDDEMEKLQSKVKNFVFDLNLKTVPVGELISIEQMGSLLISNFSREQDPEAYESITYFNFLSQGAVFIDCNSIENSHLVDDARKAEIFVIEESEIVNQKYAYLLEILKNSP